MPDDTCLISQINRLKVHQSDLFPLWRNIYFLNKLCCQIGKRNIEFTNSPPFSINMSFREPWAVGVFSILVFIFNVRFLEGIFLELLKKAFMWEKQSQVKQSLNQNTSLGVNIYSMRLWSIVYRSDQLTKASSSGTWLNQRSANGHYMQLSDKLQATSP